MKATLCGALKLNGAKEEEDLLLRRVEALNKKMLEIVNESVENGEDIESREMSSKISQMRYPDSTNVSARSGKPPGRMSTREGGWSSLRNSSRK